eukprot:CAMPEP_0167741250 /NCGR_PEP_ID=MMETSP0110_2-20121227/752_1 /TAXON_ID=629695 /ORGANISM="Gymnochlora sp., Strain CCMP2014" /LENGTH=111 /DNA_ID=CAMNT_0007625281 /DNA_START=175 /DNA_END=510 /DNA_ORIENTATION=-
MTLGLQFGLFKTYAVPSISAVLIKTGQFTSGFTTCNRRYDDTDLIIGEILCHGDMDHPRSKLAIRRLNWLHGHYKISNEDFLYTLAVFACESVQWVKRWGWREMTWSVKLI